MTDAPPLNYQPQNADACMILMHGLGASGEDLHPLAPTLANGRLRVVSPHAPIRSVTINNGWKMRAWYDIVGVDLESRQDADGVRASTAIVEQLIAAEKARGFAANQIFLAGFSQGAAMALHVGLRHAEALAGIVALSGYLLFADNIADDVNDANRQTPIFQAHGSFDAVVLPQWARASRDRLKGNGYALTYREYPMAHAIMPDELNDLTQWLNDILAVAGSDDA